MRSKFAFTLAEVLITIGIIGVVAAITIPNLITNYQKKVTVTKLKQTYSLLNQAIKRSEHENGDMSSWDYNLTADEYFKKYLIPYINTHSKNTTENLKTSRYPYKYLNGQATIMFVDSTVVDIYTINDVDIVIPKTVYTGFTEGRINIKIDINGVNNKPNVYGKDSFYMLITPEHGLFFMGTYNDAESSFETEPNFDRSVLIGTKSPQRGNNNYPCGNNGKGLWCGRLIQVDNWEIRSDYPW